MERRNASYFVTAGYNCTVETPGPPLRLAYLLSQYPAVNHVFMLREVRYLRQSGFEIHVFSIGAPDRPLDSMTEAERAEVPSTRYVKTAGVRRFAAAHIATLFTRPVAYVRGLLCALRLASWSPGNALYGLFYFTEALVVGRAVLRLRLSHLHTHFASTVALIVARTFPITISATFHGHGEFGDPSAFQLRRKVRACLFSCAVSRSGLSHLKYVSDPSQWSRLALTPLGVDPADFPARPFRPQASPFQLIAVGLLGPVKGLPVLLAALEALVREGHNILLRIAGDGPDRSALERQVQDRGLGASVFFLGSVNQDKLRALYSETDALVLPSFDEGLPVVLMEAMAMEIPCIASWISGIPELIRDGVDGLLVPPGDETALSRAILRLKTNTELRLNLGLQARRRVLEEYNLLKNAGRLADVFRRQLLPAASPLAAGGDTQYELTER